MHLYDSVVVLHKKHRFRPYNEVVGSSSYLFAERFSVEMPGRLWRFINQSDIVARVPPGPLYRHVGAIKRIVSPGVLSSKTSYCLPSR